MGIYRNTASWKDKLYKLGISKKKSKGVKAHDVRSRRLRMESLEGKGDVLLN
jgi:hypothetical protein